jgi:hypothetical protein
MKLKDATLPELEVELLHALDRARAVAWQAHEVRSDPARQWAIDAAWRAVHSAQWKIEQVKNAAQTQ